MMRLFIVILLFLPVHTSAAALLRSHGGAVVVGTIYYVSAAAGGGGNGLSPSTPWTLAQANAGVFGAGDEVLLTGSFSGVGGVTLTTANWSGVTPPTASAPVTFGVYGSGATINSGTSSCFAATNVAAFILENLVCVGGGQTSTTIDGVFIQNTNAGNSKLDFVHLVNLDVSQYGRNGILIYGGGPATAGFSDVSIIGCTAHDNTGGVTPPNPTAGIQVFSANGYSLGNTVPSFTGVLLDHDVAYNNTGHSGGVNWSGSGIFVGETGGATIQYSSAHDNGANSNTSSGPVGIWAADGINITIQYSESYDNLTGAAGFDGDGFDLDGGCVNCTLQYNYAHGNDGAGYLIYTYGGTGINNNNNVVRYNLSQNNGQSSNVEAEIVVGDDSGVMTNVEVYNNTAYSNVPAASVLKFQGTSLTSITGNVANNIFYSAGATHIVGFGSAGNPSGIALNGNDYYSTGAFSAVWNATTYTSFAAWKSGSGQETVNGGFSTLPGLVSAGSGGSGMTNGYEPSLVSGYQLGSGAAMKGVGINLLSQFSINPGTQDYFGNAIPNSVGTGYNVGAYGGT